MDLVLLAHVALAGVVVVLLVVTVATLPWRADEILALRRVGVAASSVLADRVRRWWRSL